jgi:hypothetical protein
VLLTGITPKPYDTEVEAMQVYRRPRGNFLFEGGMYVEIMCGRPAIERVCTVYFPQLFPPDPLFVAPASLIGQQPPNVFQSSSCTSIAQTAAFPSPKSEVFDASSSSQSGTRTILQLVAKEISPCRQTLGRGREGEMHTDQPFL